MDIKRVEGVMYQLGFLESEVILYVECLRSGFMSAGEFSRKTGIKRSTVYYFLYRLIDRGLLKMNDQDGIARYQAERPQKLFEL